MPRAVKDQVIGVIAGKIYNVGGKTTRAVVTNNQIYDVATNTWSTGAPMPRGLWNSANAVVKNILYVFGGSTNGTFSGIVDYVWAYNPKTNVWNTMKTAMPTAREAAVAVVENNIVYVIGGVNKGEARLATVESYDPATDTWDQPRHPASLLVAKSRFAGGLIKPTIVAAGGLVSAHGVSGDNEGYDATTNSWSSLAADPTSRVATCNGVIGAALYNAGGTGEAATAVTANDSFNLAKNKWTTKAPIPLAVAAAGSAVYKGQLYCFGGGSMNLTGFVGKVYKKLQIYQP